MKQHKVEMKHLKVVIQQFQDGEGEGLKSREGISVTHYPEHFKEEVVAFAKATSQKDAKDRLPKYLQTLRFPLLLLDLF